MANPQQPEVRRSERNPALSPDAMRAKIEARRDDQENAELLNNANDPLVDLDHTPPADDNSTDQDKPNLVEFAEAFGTKPADSTGS